jgi:hypothetical protein
MDYLVSHFHIVTGVSILIVAFLFHWVGQLISVLNWDFATRLGLQEKKLLPEHKVYEHGIAVADVSLGWIYGIAGLGLVIGAPWAFKLAWIPGIVLIYHAISYWFWTRNRNRAGHQMESNAIRILWTVANLITGAMAIHVAWYGT